MSAFGQYESKKRDGTTYYETDLDTFESKDLAQVTALLASYQLLPGQADLSPEPAAHRTSVGLLRSPPPSTGEGNSAFRTVVSINLYLHIYSYFKQLNHFSMQNKVKIV